MPNALAAVSGVNPTSMKKATSCTRTENIDEAVKKKTVASPQNTGVRSAARKVQPSPAFFRRASRW